MRRSISLAIAAAALVAGCSESHPTLPGLGRPIAVQGQIEPGAECPMLAVSPGRRYSLGGDLQGFQTGDWVIVRGRLAEVSYCMAGDGTIAVEAIGPATAPR